MVREVIDVEALVVRAYRDELVDRAMGGPAVSAGAPAVLMGGSGWASVARIAMLGTMVDGGSGGDGHEPPAWAVAVHKAVVGLPEQAAALVVRYARVGGAPEWDVEAPLVWRGRPARNGKGVLVERWQADGYAVTWCPVDRDYAVEAAALGRAEYGLWWEALAVVAGVVAQAPAVRARWVVGPPKAARTPWVDKPLEFD